VAVHCGSLGSAPALRQFGFWLLNRAALAEGEVTRPNENGVLLLLDPPARLAGLTLGYQLEAWLPEATLERVLTSARRGFRSGRLAEGAVRIMRELELALREVLRSPAVATRAEVSATPLDGLRRLRADEGTESIPNRSETHEL